jgi:hypothetical protein
MPTFNTTDPKPGYVYDSAIDTWFPLVGIAPASQVDRWTKTAAGGETSLSGNDDNAVSLSYTSGTEQVYLNGVLLVRGQDYTATNGTTITGLTTLAASDVAEVVTFNPSNILTTDAVIATDFEAKGDLISASAASTPIRLPVGTTGQVLKANSATTSGLEWGTVDADIEGVTAGTGISGGGTSGTVTITNSMATAIAAKGDLIVGTGSQTFVSQSVGANGTVLTANSAEADGVEWTSPLPSQTGNSGKFLTTNGTNASWGSAGTTFNHRTNLTGAVKTIQYNGSDLYVAAGSTGKLSTSPDGITWTSRTSGFGTNNISAVAFGNGLWVAVGQNGTITTSTDGITWTARTSNFSTNLLYDVKYANGVWVAVGAGGGSTNTGGITYSTDGTTWTRKSQSITVGTIYHAVNYNGTNWIVGANNSTNNYLYASTPSGTWTAGADGGGSDILYVFWDGTRNIVSTETEGLRYSTSTTLGTTTRFTGVEVVQQASGQRLYYYNGNVYYNGFFIGSFSTTPMTGNYGQINYSIQSPTTWSSTTTTASMNAGAIWADSSGIIVGSSTNIGQIFTSF